MGYIITNMSENNADIDLKYRLFIEKVAASKLVWVLKNKKGLANANSSDDEEIAVIPFWSERSYAKVCAKQDWSDYSATEVPLTDFLENWCLSMATDKVLAGVNWDANMFGKEVDSLQLSLDILHQLKNIQSAIKFSDYDGIDEFIAEIQESIDEA